MKTHRLFVAAVLLLAACAEGDSTPSSTTTVADVRDTIATTQHPATTAAAGDEDATTCADVVDVDVSSTGAGVYRFDVTVSSPDTGWDKYADAWEVRDPAGNVLGIRELTHPHVDEQPFTRSLSGVEIPPDVESVVVAARDSVEGFCGIEMTVDVG